MKKRGCKKAIALISLVMVIIVLIMISGITTYLGYDILYESKKTAYAKDILAVQEAVEEYYMVNGSIPNLDGGKVIDATQYIANINTLKGTDASNFLSLEIQNNNDDGEDVVFYEIDLSKIGIEESSYGVKENGNENDIYLVSNDTHVVYYYPGHNIDGKVYFSNLEMLNKNS